MVKNYNTYRKEYRFIQYDKSSPDIKSITRYDKNTIKPFKKINNKLYEHFNLQFIPKNYKPYFVWLLSWSLRRVYDKNKKAIATLIKNPVVSLIIGTLIVYAIMKFILKWI